MTNPSSADPSEITDVLGLSSAPETLGAGVRVFYGHWSPRILSALALGFVALRLAWGRGSAWDAAVALAVVALWPLQEWLIHVCILHFKPVAVLGRVFDPRTPRTHRAHHREPWRIDLVFIPTHVFLYVPIALGALWLLAGPLGPRTLTGVAVYFLLSLHYEWVHFLVHTRVRPRSAFYRRLWRNHRQHHFKNEHYWFGVTMLGGDRLLRSAPDPSAVPTSPTCRSLEAGAAQASTAGW